MRILRVGTAAVILGAAGGLCHSAGPLAGQVPDSLRAATEVAQAQDSLLRDTSRRISPRSAFIRSALVPGWGHAGVGAFVRGAFYFSAEAASAEK